MCCLLDSALDKENTTSPGSFLGLNRAKNREGSEHLGPDVFLISICLVRCIVRGLRLKQRIHLFLRTSLELNLGLPYGTLAFGPSSAALSSALAGWIGSGTTWTQTSVHMGCSIRRAVPPIVPAHWHMYNTFTNFVHKIIF